MVVGVLSPGCGLWQLCLPVVCPLHGVLLAELLVVLQLFLELLQLLLVMVELLELLGGFELLLHSTCDAEVSLLKCLYLGLHWAFTCLILGNIHLQLLVTRLKLRLILLKVPFGHTCARYIDLAVLLHWHVWNVGQRRQVARHVTGQRSCPRCVWLATIMHLKGTIRVVHVHLGVSTIKVLFNLVFAHCIIVNHEFLIGAELLLVRLMSWKLSSFRGRIDQWFLILHFECTATGSHVVIISSWLPRMLLESWRWPFKIFQGLYNQFWVFWILLIEIALYKPEMPPYFLVLLATIAAFNGLIAPKSLLDCIYRYYFILELFIIKFNSTPSGLLFQILISINHLLEHISPSGRLWLRHFWILFGISFRNSIGW